MVVRGATIVIVVLLALAPAVQAQTVAPPFDQAYSWASLGAPPGVPSPFGGLTLKAGTTDRLLIGAAANSPHGKLYEIGLVRDAQGHISGFSGTATEYADAPHNDGGVAYGPEGVLFVARWPLNQLGQIRPGNPHLYKRIPLGPFNVAHALAALQFVPSGQPGAGSLKLSSYGGGQWYDAAIEPDGDGMFNLVNVRRVSASTLPGGPEGFVYVAPGSPQFARPSLLVAEYGADNVAAYEVDLHGDPVVASRRTFVSGLENPEGALLDTLTGDYLFSTFGGAGRVIVVRGSAPPVAPRVQTTSIPALTAPVTQPSQPQLPPPEAGKTVNAVPKRGRVRIKRPGTNRFVNLDEGQQIPVGSVVDTTEGRVTIIAAGGQSADFYDGIFRLTQGKRAEPLTTLTLVQELRCAEGGSARAAAKPKTRRLWGEGTGKFRTRGRHSAATVVGTTWLVQDRCTSTLTRVVRGRVSVRDFAKKKNVIVRAGDRYVAKARRG